MKTVKFASLFIALFALSMSITPTYAISGDEPKEISDLREQITKLVKAPQLEVNGISAAKVYLRFMLNNKNEIVVLSTGTDNAYLDAFIKNRLNYKAVKNVPLKEKFYNMSIVFKTD